MFKAVADHHRRHLLDLLAQADGQTLTQLCASLPMSRIGVMKHLDILEQAGPDNDPQGRAREIAFPQPGSAP